METGNNDLDRRPGKMSGKDEELQFISLPMTPGGPSLVQSAASGKLGGGDGIVGGVMREAKHPMACLFHVLFKALSLFFYMFGGWFTSNDVFIFVMIIVMLACDFWTVKVSGGRLHCGDGGSGRLSCASRFACAPACPCLPLPALFPCHLPHAALAPALGPVAWP